MYTNLTSPFPPSASWMTFENTLCYADCSVILRRSNPAVWFLALTMINCFNLIFSNFVSGFYSNLQAQLHYSLSKVISFFKE